MNNNLALGQIMAWCQTGAHKRLSIMCPNDAVFTDAYKCAYVCMCLIYVTNEQFISTSMLPWWSICGNSDIYIF